MSTPPPALAEQASNLGWPQPDRLDSFTGVSKRGFHRVAYVEWGDAGSDRVVICLHGLTRQGRDFDRLAAALAAQGWRVVCPDLPGRGQSDPLLDPADYNLPQYAMDMTALIARLGVDQVSWIGTSLGGLTGIVMAGQPRSPIRRMVVNDIGPFLPWEALHRIATNVSKAPRVFRNLDAARAHTRTSLAPFGNLSDDEWDHLTRHGVEELPDGQYAVLCDAGISVAFGQNLLFNLSLWNYWDRIACPTLVMRGAASDLLRPGTLAEMGRRGPRAETVTIPGCGHAPALLDQSQISLVVDWLNAAPD